MQVYLDGKPIATARPTLACALADATAAARSEGRVVIEVKADGALLSDDSLTDPSDEPASFAQVHMLSADPRSLVRVTLGDAADALRGLTDEQARIAELIQTDRLQDAVVSLQGVFQTWQAVKDVTARSGALLEIDLTTLALASPSGADTTLAHASTRLLGKLRAVKGVLEREDWSSLADLLEFDLCEESREWTGLISALADHVHKLPPEARD